MYTNKTCGMTTELQGMKLVTAPSTQHISITIPHDDANRQQINNTKQGIDSLQTSMMLSTLTDLQQSELRRQTPQ